MYQLPVVTMPTHRARARWDHPPRLFLSRQKKLDTVIHEVSRALSLKHSSVLSPASKSVGSSWFSWLCSGLRLPLDCFVGTPN